MGGGGVQGLVGPSCFLVMVGTACSLGNVFCVGIVYTQELLKNKLLWVDRACSQKGIIAVASSKFFVWFEG